MPDNINLATGIVRLPAAFQSIFGFRPTTGIISNQGVVPVSSTPRQKALEAFVSPLETYLNLERKLINLNHLWLTVSDILISDSYHAHAGFVKEYHEKYGRHPFLSPLRNREFGSGISAESRADPLIYAGFSWRSDFQSPLAELPDLVIPGSEMKLLAVMEDFVIRSGKSTVKTGRYPFEVDSKGLGLRHQL
ncbi:hypothetical protein QBC34DRAFT_424090 [Podospora aff. communis PSN243]|uniref:Amidase domain-containing protein n=1 Tax=Podospora aff. communis PSN243 TaxID=3040156 RepID=A0AAV9GSL1_9PEZI|nr:hypothetical protein QBC34DRAFT_424090 [Podospora aff. communis PSN243]